MLGLSASSVQGLLPPQPPAARASATSFAMKAAAAARKGGPAGLYPEGKHKWLGGAVTPDGDILGIPSHAPSVVKVTPGDEPVIEFLGEGMAGLNPQRNGWSVKFKWLRGMVVGDACYGIPAWADSVMKVCLKTWAVTTFGEEELRPAALAADAARVSAKKESTLQRKQRRGQPIQGQQQQQQQQRRRQQPGQIEDEDNEEEGADDDEEEEEEEEEEEGGGGAEDGGVPSGWRWMWHGAALADDGRTIYAIPACADRVLRVDTVTGDVKRVGPAMPGMQKWYGGIKGAPGSDGAIYGMPYGAGPLLKINPAAAPEDVTVEHVFVQSREGTPEALPDGDRWRWHGGVRSPLNGAIYAFPAHAEHVLKVDTLKGGETSQLGVGPDAPAAVAASMKGRYKWLGGCLGADGAVYGVPSDSACILRVDPATDAVTTFGHGSVPPDKNKWQGGVLAPDGLVYCIPSDATSILCIDTNPGVFERLAAAASSEQEGEADGGTTRHAAVTLIGDLPTTKDKWQGGFLGKDGAIYGIPECAERILKVIPETGEVLQLRYPGEE